MTIEPTDEISARLVCHEFVLEVIFANLLAEQDEETAERVMSDLVDRVRNHSYIRDDATEEEAGRLFSIQEETVRVMERLVEKVRERTKNILGG